MISPIHIIGSGCVSIQPTVKPDELFCSLRTYAQGPVEVPDPDYKAFIPALQLRRMNKSMRMAIFAARLALQEARRQSVEAVITGTGLGCLRDSERFLETILESEGSMLNPTPFIQSTHNMAAAAIALSLGCKGYNMTYVHNALSFESALLDALVYASEHPDQAFLLGGVDELGSRSTQFWELAGYLKHDTPAIPTSLVEPKTPGEVAAEGAAFFVASCQPTGHSLGKVLSVDTCYRTDDPDLFIRRFLARNNVDLSTVDAVMLGYNGDSRYDTIYDQLTEGCLTEKAIVGYKHVLGEFDTVSAAALFVALYVLKRNHIPEVLHVSGPVPKALNRILVYNQRRGVNHALILVER